MDEKPNFFKRWFKWGRVIPGFTILAGGLVVTFSALGYIQTTITDAVIISLLILLAADALSERITILEDLRERIDKISAKSSLRNRDDIELKPRLETAKQVSILAVSGVNLLRINMPLFEEYIHRKGTILRFLLVDPNCEALKHYHELDYKTESTPQLNIDEALVRLKDLKEIAEKRGSKCEVKLLKCVIPYSMIMIERQQITDIMWVEFHNYKIQYGKRPNIMLRRGDESTWFSFYEAQYEDAWNEGEAWKY